AVGACVLRSVLRPRHSSVGSLGILRDPGAVGVELAEEPARVGNVDVVGQVLARALQIRDGKVPLSRVDEIVGRLNATADVALARELREERSLLDILRDLDLAAEEAPRHMLALVRVAAVAGKLKKAESLRRVLRDSLASIRRQVRPTRHLTAEGIPEAAR